LYPTVSARGSNTPVPPRLPIECDSARFCLLLPSVLDATFAGIVGERSMKRLLIAVVFWLVAFEASALTRYDIDDMTCAQIQALVAADGAATLRYKSKRYFSLPLYDTYVSGQKSCDGGEVALRSGVPSTDQKYCPVYKCVESSTFVAR
jgi:hypothetical protein